jgi:hypothetical protein
MSNVLENPALELVNELGNNVKTISYDTEKESWIITYKNDLESNEFGNDSILDFLRNA